MEEIRNVIVEQTSSGEKRTTYSSLVLSLSLIIYENNAKLNLIFASPFVGPPFYTYVVISTGAITHYISEIFAGNALIDFSISNAFQRSTHVFRVLQLLYHSL